MRAASSRSGCSSDCARNTWAMLRGTSRSSSSERRRIEPSPRRSMAIRGAPKTCMPAVDMALGESVGARELAAADQLGGDLDVLVHAAIPLQERDVLSHAIVDG